jgi:hypothetical protein
MKSLASPIRSSIPQRHLAAFVLGYPQQSPVQLRRVRRGDPSKRTISPSALAARTTRSSPRARLSLIARHLENRPLLEINTPFSTERQSGPQDELLYTPLIREIPADIQDFRSTLPSSNQKERPSTMTSQPEHPTLRIPGPIEFDDEVLQAMGHYRYALRTGPTT